MQTEEITFQSGALSLVGIIYIPRGAGPFPAVVVCHPHPQYGGSMDNNVVDSLCEALAARSIIALKFNFRGVDGSQGTFSNGIGEQEDSSSAVSFLSTRKEADPHRIGIAGYSAGSAWGLNAGCQDTRVKALAAISPPITMFNFKCIQDCSRPKFLILGTADELIPAKPFLRFCQSLPEPKEYQIIEGANHSWRGFEAVVAEKVADYFIKVI